MYGGRYTFACLTTEKLKIRSYFSPWIAEIYSRSWCIRNNILFAPLTHAVGSLEQPYMSVILVHIYI